MKAILTFAIFMFALSQAEARNILVANNNPNAPMGNKVYPNLPAAITAAISGDTIHVMPSPSSYGDVTIDKKLTMYGIGFNPDKDLAEISRVGKIIIKSINASGTRLAGLVVSRIELAPAVGSSYTLHGIVIEKCQITNLNSTALIVHADKNNTLDSLIIKNCLIMQSQQFDPGTSIINLAQDSKLLRTTIANNIFTGTVYSGFINAGNSALIRNNIFIGDGKTGRRAFETILDCIVVNNIFYGVAPLGVKSERNVFEYNFSFGTSNDTLPPVGTGVGNMGNPATNKPGKDPQFINVPQGSNYNFSHDPHLKDTAPGKNAGSDDTDIGIFGGETPYSESGTPLPFIKALYTSTVINKGDNLTITIQAKTK
jgi:hypothetical protein